MIYFCPNGWDLCCNSTSDHSLSLRGEVGALLSSCMSQQRMVSHCGCSCARVNSLLSCSPQQQRKGADTRGTLGSVCVQCIWKPEIRTTWPVVCFERSHRQSLLKSLACVHVCLSPDAIIHLTAGLRMPPTSFVPDLKWPGGTFSNVGPPTGSGYMTHRFYVWIVLGDGWSCDELTVSHDFYWNCHHRVRLH